MERLNGKATAEEIRSELKEAVLVRKQKGEIPHLAAVLVGNDVGSMSYECQSESMMKLDLKAVDSI